MARVSLKRLSQPSLFADVAAKPVKPRNMTANGLTNNVIQFVFSIGGFAWRNNTGAATYAHTSKEGKTTKHFVRFGLVGSSDVLGASAEGRMLALEVKTENDTLRDEQKLFLQDICKRGGIALVLKTTDEQDYKQRITYALANPNECHCGMCFKPKSREEVWGS